MSDDFTRNVSVGSLDDPLSWVSALRREHARRGEAAPFPLEGVGYERLVRDCAKAQARHRSRKVPSLAPPGDALEPLRRRRGR